MERLILPEEGLLHLFGLNDENLRYLERKSGVKIVSRGNEVQLDGPPEEVAVVKGVMEGLAELQRQGYTIKNGDLKVALRLKRREPEVNLSEFFLECRLKISENRDIYPKSINQRHYIRCMTSLDMTFGIGPAGTGKTYLAAAAGVAALNKEEVKRIILARPAIEAGEKLGFLPGDMAAKVDPYLRPLYDALWDFLGAEKVSRLIEKGVIEIAPLAFMRGRNHNDAFIILDEAQNTTTPQMKMFLTRMGNNSKVVVNGDITQIDLPSDRKSGLVEAIDLLSGIPGLSFVYFDKGDIVRHPLVEKIVLAYEEAKKRERREDKGKGEQGESEEA
jgi:phosphate starvation-inducible PhoH-like protein